MASSHANALVAVSLSEFMNLHTINESNSVVPATIADSTLLTTTRDVAPNLAAYPATSSPSAPSAFLASAAPKPLVSLDEILAASSTPQVPLPEHQRACQVPYLPYLCNRRFCLLRCSLPARPAA